MAFRRYVIAVLLFVAVVGIAFATMQIADAGRDEAAVVERSVTNESINQQVDIWQFVNQALDDDTAGFNDTVTVYNSSGNELTEGVDYEWNATDGTILYHNTASVTDGNSGSISYDYDANTRRVTGLSRVIDPVVSLVSWSPLAVAGLGLGVLLLAAVTIIGRVIGDSGPKTNR